MYIIEKLNKMVQKIAGNWYIYYIVKNNYIL